MIRGAAFHVFENLIRRVEFSSNENIKFRVDFGIKVIISVLVLMTFERNTPGSI